jgi:hypothetical protein
MTNDPTPSPHPAEHISGTSLFAPPSKEHKAALERAERTGETYQQARNNIRLDAVQDGAKATGIISRLRAALSGEKEAREKLDQASQLRAVATGLQMEWERMLTVYEHTRGQLFGAAHSIETLKGGIEGAEEYLALHIGTDRIPTHAHFVELVQGIASARAAIPYAEKALEAVRARLKAHVAEMLKWGAANGVPKDILAGLSA